MSRKTLYEVLDVARDASPEEIKIAFRKMAKIHHPDKGGDAAAMHRVNLAYEILMDPEKRKNYDEHGEEFASKYEDAFRRVFLDILDMAAKKYGPGHLKDGFGKVISEALAALAENEKRAKRDLEGCQKSMERVGPADDVGTRILREVLKAHITEMEHALAEVAGKRMLLTRVQDAGLKMDYRDDMDVQRVMISTWGFPAGTSSTGGWNS